MAASGTVTKLFTTALICSTIWMMESGAVADAKSDGSRRDTSYYAYSSPIYRSKMTPSNNYNNYEYSEYDDIYNRGCTANRGDPDGDCIPGKGGINYPVWNHLPPTRFSCKQYPYPGYFADVDTYCQVFHICEWDGRQHSILCPKGTIFNQDVLVCDWWYNVECSRSIELYGKIQIGGGGDGGDLRYEQDYGHDYDNDYELNEPNYRYSDFNDYRNRRNDIVSELVNEMKKTNTTVKSIPHYWNSRKNNKNATEMQETQFPSYQQIKIKRDKEIFGQKRKQRKA